MSTTSALPSRTINVRVPAELYRQLEDLARAGRPGRVYGTKELVLHRRCVAVYRVKEDEVHILTVLHTARER